MYGGVKAVASSHRIAGACSLAHQMYGLVKDLHFFEGYRCFLRGWRTSGGINVRREYPWYSQVLALVLPNLSSSGFLRFLLKFSTPERNTSRQRHRDSGSNYRAASISVLLGQGCHQGIYDQGIYDPFLYVGATVDNTTHPNSWLIASVKKTRE